MAESNYILLQILDAIGFEGDKDKFVDEFNQNVKSQSLINLISRLPEDKAKEIKQKLSQLTATDDNNVVKEFFTDEEFIAELKETSKESVKNYLDQIIPTLSNDQRDAIFSLLEKA